MRLPPNLDYGILKRRCVDGYSNTFFRHKQFVDSIAHVGINGLIVVDLDDSERTVWRQKLAASEIDLISLLAPTSSPERQKKILADSAALFITSR